MRYVSAWFCVCAVLSFLPASSVDMYTQGQRSSRGEFLSTEGRVSRDKFIGIPKDARLQLREKGRRQVKYLLSSAAASGDPGKLGTQRGRSASLACISSRYSRTRSRCFATRLPTQNPPPVCLRPWPRDAASVLIIYSGS